MLRGVTQGPFRERSMGKSRPINDLKPRNTFRRCLLLRRCLQLCRSVIALHDHAIPNTDVRLASFARVAPGVAFVVFGAT